VREEELAAWLAGRTTAGIRWGLERTRELLAGADDPHRRFASVLIGGTNGKGSVAALCEAALREAGGHRVGLYTSPHLVSFRERIRIDGRPIGGQALARAAERLRPAIERTGATFFEATTAIAFLCFAEAGVDVAVVEVGLGGRLDATNVLDPVATAVTNVALDHADYLGETLPEIAREKAGIFRGGVPALTGESEAGALAVLRAEAERVGASFVELDRIAALGAVETDARGTCFDYRSERWGEGTLALPLPGAHQARNALLALELLGTLPDALRPALGAIERGFAAVRWPGRLQVEEVGGTTFVFDVAHNPAGAESLAAALDARDLPRPLVLVAGILSDKAWREMLPPLIERADAVILTTPPTAPVNRRWDPLAAASALPESGRPLRVIDDFAAALSRATTLAPHGTVLVTGSVHTVGDALAELGLDPL
jgi:dihydrofolate synthase/folylpolyglutamate synthase